MIIRARGERPCAAQTPARSPGPGQLLVRIRAAALNFADLLMAKAEYQETPPFPFVPGHEGSGEVLAAGEGVSLPVGQRVAILAPGTMAQAGVFDAASCVPIPDGMSHETAAGFLIAYGTSHLALTARAGLRAGETLVVLGAAGGVGLTAVETGAALGARVIAVARGADRLAAAAKAGASLLIDSDDCPDLRARLRELGGADVVYDPVGDAPGLAAFGALHPGGRFLLIGFAGGNPPALPLNHALVKNIAIHGFYWGGYRQLDPASLRNDMSQLLALFESGAIKPRPPVVMPLAELSKAYDLLETRRAVGKLVISI